MTLASVLIALVFGIGMTGTFFSADTRYELFDLYERPRNCEVYEPNPEPGALIPGKGKATNLSSNVEYICRFNIFSNFERPSYVNFVTQHASRQARQSAHTLSGLMEHLTANGQSSVRFAPLDLKVKTGSDRLDTYVQDVFHAAFAAEFGAGKVTHRRHWDDEDASDFMVSVTTRPVDAPDIMFAVSATLIDGEKTYRWQL